MTVDYGIPLSGITLLTSEGSSCYFNIEMVTLSRTSLLMIEIFVFTSSMYAMPLKGDVQSLCKLPSLIPFRVSGE